MTNSWHDQIARALQVPSLRTHQVQGISALLDRRHNLLLTAATGAGKSNVFWGAGLHIPGVTVVISPLIALMGDQKARLESLGLPVFVWNSAVRPKAKGEFLKSLRDGWSGFLYVTPESLKGAELKSALRGKVGLCAVDEAHCCLTDRGFRYTYAWLGRLIDHIEPSIRMATTATLIPSDRQRLIDTLHLRNPEQVFVPVSRSNLVFRKIARTHEDLYEILDRHNGEAGIVYCATVRSVMTLYSQLASQGYNVTFYHGELRKKGEKDKQQKLFMSGKKNVVFATDSFGLGIDHPHLRFVCHYDYAASIEAWIQGAGRAGRDDEPAHIYPAFGSDEGINSRWFLIQQSNPTLEQIREMWEHLRKSPWHRKTHIQLGREVWGHDGKWLGPSAMTKLTRFRLADAKRDPDDGRKQIYYATGDFDRTDWRPYLSERKDAFARFTALKELAKLPSDQLKEAIDAYFENEDGLQDAPF